MYSKLKILYRLWNCLDHLLVREGAAVGCFMEEGEFGAEGNSCSSTAVPVPPRCHAHGTQTARTEQVLCPYHSPVMARQLSSDKAGTWPSQDPRLGWGKCGTMLGAGTPATQLRQGLSSLTHVLREELRPQSLPALMLHVWARAAQPDCIRAGLEYGQPNPQERERTCRASQCSQSPGTAHLWVTQLKTWANSIYKLSNTWKLSKVLASLWSLPYQENATSQIIFWDPSVGRCWTLEHSTGASHPPADMTEVENVWITSPSRYNEEIATINKL